MKDRHGEIAKFRGRFVGAFVFLIWANLALGRAPIALPPASHDGKQEKTRTRFVVYPGLNNSVVVMTNSEWVDPGKFSTLIYTALAKK